MKALFALLVFGVVAANSPSTSTPEVQESNVSSFWGPSVNSPAYGSGSLTGGGFFAGPPLEATCKYCYNEPYGPTGLPKHYFEDNSCSGGGNALQLVGSSALAGKELGHSPARASSSEGEGGGCRDCKAFNSCHVNTQDFTCQEMHTVCGAGVSFASTAVKVFDRLTVASARELAESSAGNLRYIEERGVLASLDCRGKIIGYVAVALTPIPAFSAD